MSTKRVNRNSKAAAFPRVRRWPARAKRKAFVLLVVLVFLVISALQLVNLADHSFRLAEYANGLQADVQRRWGAVSCRRAVLPVAEYLFEAIDEQFAGSETPTGITASPRIVSADVVLGGQRFDLVLADESAKIDLNAVYHFQDPGRVQQLLQTTVRQAVLPIRPSPAVDSARIRNPDALDQWPSLAFRSWGEVFDLHHLNGPGTLRAATSRITCWGSMRLNIRRADESSVHEIVELVASQQDARRLVEEIARRPRDGVQLLLERLSLDADERSLLEELLTDHSSSFSLWVSGSHRRQRWSQFSVLEVSEEGVVHTTSFML